jgi:hypothetical protein
MLFDPKTLLLTLLLSGSMFWGVSRSTNGYGLPQPEVNPPSIREGSVRVRSGRHRRRSRYFVSGGFHGGK